MGDGIGYAGQVFSCRSNTIARYYFTAPAGADVSAAFVSGGEGETLEVAKSGNYVVVSVSDIASAQLDDEYVIELSVGDAAVGTLTVSPMAYVKSVLAGNQDEALVNLAKAIYVYGTAASAFFD